MSEPPPGAPPGAPPGIPPGAPPGFPILSKEYLTANKGPETLAILIIFPILSTIVVVLRLYTRFRIVNATSYEDLVIFAALIFGIATTICQCFQVQNGMGRHMYALTPDQGINNFKALFASILMYTFALTFIKISIALQYKRIAIDKHVRLWCWLFIWFAIVNCIQVLLVNILTCLPVARFWDKRIPGKCVNTIVLYYVLAGINIFQDVWLLILPVFILQKLLLPWKQKLGLILILGLGGFASIASILRLHSLYVIAHSTDIPWDSPGTASWSAIELNVGIICASLPTLRAFLAQWFPRAFASSFGNSNVRQYHRNRSGSNGRQRSGAQVLPDEKMFGSSKGSSGNRSGIGSGSRLGDTSTLGDRDIVVKFEVDVEGRAETIHSQGSEIEMTGRTFLKE